MDDLVPEARGGSQIRVIDFSTTARFHLLSRPHGVVRVVREDFLCSRRNNLQLILHRTRRFRWYAYDYSFSFDKRSHRDDGDIGSR